MRRLIGGASARSPDRPRRDMRRRVCSEDMSRRSDIPMKARGRASPRFRLLTGSIVDRRRDNVRSTTAAHQEPLQCAPCFPAELKMPMKRRIR